MPSFDELTQILTDRDQIAILRRDVAAELGESGDTRAIPFLIDVLEDASTIVRREVVTALGKFDNPAVTPPLLLALARETDELTRREMIEILGQVGTREALLALTAMLESHALLTRVGAQKSLNQIERRYPDIVSAEDGADPPTMRLPSLDQSRNNQSQPADTSESSRQRAVDIDAEMPTVIFGRTADSPPAIQVYDVSSPENKGARYGVYGAVVALLLVVGIVGIFYYQQTVPEERPATAGELSSAAQEYLTQADFHFQEEDYQHAIEQYEWGRSLAPGHLDLRRRLGYAYLQQGQYSAAAQEYEFVVRSDLEDVEAYNELGKAYMHQGQFQKALKTYQRAIEISPNFAPAYNNLALLYAGGSIEQIRLADIPAWQAIRLNPAEAIYHDTLGWVLYKQGQINKSIQALEEAIRLRSDLVEAHYHLALAALKANQRDKALREIQTVLQLDPAFIHLALTTLRSNQQDKVLEAIRAVLQLNPDAANAAPKSSWEEHIVEKAQDIQSIRKELLGQLPWPVVGEVVPNQANFDRGITIQARCGTPVRCVADGIVAKTVKSIAGYGNAILVAHGNGYISVYARLSNIDIQPGDAVRADQIVGQVAEAGSTPGEAFYFELWHNYNRLDTKRWLGEVTQMDTDGEGREATDG